MNVYEFLEELSIHFPIKEDNKKQVFIRYADIIKIEIHKLKKAYDYEKLLNAILREYTFKTFPPIALILRHISAGVIDSLPAKEGETVVMITPDNRIYDFIVTGYGSNILNIKNYLKEKYTDVIIYQFPKGTTILNNRALVPNPDNTFTTQILEYKG